MSVTVDFLEKLSHIGEEENSSAMVTTKKEPVVTRKESAQTFVDRLIGEGSAVSCDDSNEAFTSNFGPPKFLDEDLFKRGQQFFYKHIFGLLFGKFIGLIVLLSVPTILKILIMTKMSGTSMTAYRRYIFTLLHMKVWYDEDFKPESDLWKSMAEVRRLHNSASKRAKKCSLNHISQMDMALTQFAFMGFAVCRSQKVGIYGATEEEWASFIHVWRVVGHMMGIEDRFNICRGTVTETRQICNLLISCIFIPDVEKMDDDFLEMAYHLIDGLWSISPLMQYESFLTTSHRIMTVQGNQPYSKWQLLKLQGYAKINFWLINWLMEKMKYHWVRTFINFLEMASLWFIRWFPFLAFPRFGFSNSYVRLSIKHV